MYFQKLINIGNSMLYVYIVVTTNTKTKYAVFRLKVDV